MEGDEYFERFAEGLRDLDSCLSRTAQGTLDTSVSESKKISTDSAPEQLVVLNRKSVLEYIATIAPHQPHTLSAESCERFVVTIAEKTLDGFAVPQLFRSWVVPYKSSCSTSVEEIPRAMKVFYSKLQLNSQNETFNPVSLAAWIEYTLNVELHPFYDACSRISRYAAVLVLFSGGRLPPRLTSREEYWLSAGKGLAVFTEYYKAGVERREAEVFNE